MLSPERAKREVSSESLEESSRHSQQHHQQQQQQQAARERERGGGARLGPLLPLQKARGGTNQDRCFL
jgi:membrane protease subunit (stomatin/prohibitin family)